MIIEFQSLISLARLSEEKSGPAVCQTYSTKELVDEVFETVNDRNKLIKILAMAKSAIRHNMGKDLPKMKLPCLIIWGKNDKAREWLIKYSKFLYIASVLTGSSFSAVEIVNSSIFGLSWFEMGLSHKQVVAFKTQRIYSVILLEVTCTQLMYIYLFFSCVICYCYAKM